MIKKSFTTYKLLNLINVSKIVTLHYFEFTKDFEFEGEKHDFWELVYADKGDVIVTAGAANKNLRQGEMIFHKPNEFHNIKANGITAPNVFIITFVCRSESMNFFKEKIIKLPPDLKQLITKIISVGRKTFALPFNDPYLTELKPLDSPLIGGQQLMQIYLEELLIRLIQNETSSNNAVQSFPPSEAADNSVTTDILNVLSDNIYGTLTIGKICEKTNYSKTTISNSFRKNTGYSIMEYYSILKIAEAKKLIREQKYNFAQISDLLCFNNPHYFSNVFKRITGMTPKEYFNSVSL